MPISLDAQKIIHYAGGVTGVVTPALPIMGLIIMTTQVHNT